MLRFVRLTGGALGVILALSFASFDATGRGFFAPTVEGRVLLGAWVAAWLVLGYAILPYITVTPAARLLSPPNSCTAMCRRSRRTSGCMQRRPSHSAAASQL